MPASPRRASALRGRLRRSLVAPLLITTLLSAVLISLSAPPSLAASGSLALSPGGAAAAALPGTLRDGGTTATFVVPGTSSGGVALAVELRAQSGLGYRAKVWVAPGGGWTQTLERVRDGKATALVSRHPSGSLNAGDRLTIQLTTVGSTKVELAARAWKSTQAKPGWQLSTSDSSTSRIGSGGAARVWAYRAASGTATTVSYSDQTSWSSSSTTTTSTSTSTASATGKPTKDSTGVPAGTALTVHQGDISVTKAGTVLNGLDIRGFVTVKAPDVTIKNSIVRGGTATYNRGVITSYGNSGLVIDHVDVLPSNTTVYQDGIKGSDFTLRHVYVTGNVDSVKIQREGNVVVEDSLLENTQYFAHDPNQGGNPTHNDGVQILSGSNIRLEGNTIRGDTNFAVLGAANQANTSGLVVKGNWLDGGHCTAKLEELNGKQLTATFSSNRFGPNRVVDSCKVAVETSVSLTASGNVMESSGDPVAVTWANT